MARRRSLLARCARGGLAIAAVLILAMGATIGVTETVCRGAATPDAAAGDRTWHTALLPEETRNEVDSYITYPEWSIVYAYDDFAAATRRGSESDFHYLESIRSFWTSLCAVKRVAPQHGQVALDYNAMLYVIGPSFTAEMSAKSLYENTIGALTAWIRGPTRTPEDEFALSVADDYAHFLRQTPWFAYPFFDTLKRFWTEVPLTGGNPVRKIERRIGLSIEYGFKTIYAKAIGILAGVSPAALRIRSAVVGLETSDIAAEPRIVFIRKSGNLSIIETPRYQTLTEILHGLAERGREVSEIAGNRNILVTVLSPQCAPLALEEFKTLFTVPIQANPGWCRHALDVRVPRLTFLFRSLAQTKNEVEHVFDY
jgi:hypothetical protein